MHVKERHEALWLKKKVFGTAPDRGMNNTRTAGNTLTIREGTEPANQSVLSVQCMVI